MGGWHRRHRSIWLVPKRPQRVYRWLRGSVCPGLSEIGIERVVDQRFGLLEQFDQATSDNKTIRGISQFLKLPVAG